MVLLRSAPRKEHWLSAKECFCCGGYYGQFCLSATIVEVHTRYYHTFSMDLRSIVSKLSILSHALLLTRGSVG